MSDFEDDFDDQLLELAGATEKKKKRRQHSGGAGAGGGAGSGVTGSRKRKGPDSDSENDREREDPYPLEGKYKNEADKRELLNMTEFQREQILEERAAEREKMRQNRALEDLVKQQQGGLAGAGAGMGAGSGSGMGMGMGMGAGGDEGGESVSRAAKRQHTARGSTKEKIHKLDELKARRKAKDDKKRSQGNTSPSHRDRSSSPQDMDISDSETSEDGQINKSEYAYADGSGGRQPPDSSSSNNNNNSNFASSRRGTGRRGEEVVDAKCTMGDLEGCRLTRDALAKHCLKPWFQDYVTGAWVRYLIGQEPSGQPVYRICQINNLAQDLVKPYKINEQTIDQAFELKHGKSIKIFNMDKVSNGPFLEKEYERLVRVCENEHVDMPTKQTLEKKVAQMGKLVSQPMTENDITAMLHRKAQLQGNKHSGLTTLQRSQLQQKRTLALRRQDLAEVAEVDAQLAEAAAHTTPDSASARSGSGGPSDMLAKVNERNRKANMEAVRRAELQESERKRRERKMAQSGSGTVTPVDPSARLKITPRTFNSNTPTTTRPGTPSVAVKAEGVVMTGGTGPVKTASSFETALIDSLEIDLGDF